MLKSKELRARAWNSLKGKYWIALAATLVSGILYSLGDGFASLSAQMLGITEFAKEVPGDAVIQMGAVVVSVMAFIVAIVGLLIAIFVGSPALVGCCNYFVKNSDSKPAFTEIFSGFRKGYGRNVKVLLVASIKLILWSLLFVIPGIIKGYEYSIIPYLIADDPELSSKDAFKKAKEMMTGNKWRLFKLQFSFIGWILLSFLTLGIGTLFLLPYLDAANAEFYVELKNKQ